MTAVMRIVRPRWLLILVFTICCDRIAWSQTNRVGFAVRAPGAPVFDEPASQLRAQLGRIEALLEAGEVDEAIEIVRQFINTAGEKIVAGPRERIPQLAGFSQFITAREYGLTQLAGVQRKFPTEFSVYRRQLDQIADRWLAQGIADRDEAILRRLTRELFLSEAADDALLALGEFALERGDYNAARNYWERLHPALRFPSTVEQNMWPAIGRPLWLSLRGVDVKSVWPVLAPLLEIPAPGAQAAPELGRLTYPDSNLNLAEMCARLALVSILEGNLERATIEISVLRQAAGQAQGTIGGRQGNLVQLLENFLTESRTWPERLPSADWVTYAGHSSRQHIPKLELHEASKPLWTLELPGLFFPQELTTANRVRVGESSDGVLAYHPIIVGNRVIVQAGYERNQLVICDRDTGQLLLSPVTTEADEWRESGRGIFGVPRFVPTVAGDRLFIRKGIALAVAPGSRERVSRPARLEALSLAAEGKLLWDFAPQGPTWGESWTLAGPPVTDGDRLYVALVRRSPLRVETHLAALDYLDGRVCWRKFLSAAEPAIDDTISLWTHTLLTLQDGVLYCNTNQGVVAACETDGNIRWLTCYPRTAFAGLGPDRNDLHFYRDLNPCLLYQDLVIVAPTDCNRLFALDAITGMPIWVTQAEVAADVVHFLGVGDNNLIASGECLYWFDVRTGRLNGQFPAPFLPAPGFARPSPRGYGRGLLAGSHIYWPTYEAILVFGQRPSAPDGKPAPLRQIPLAASGVTGGNLAAANGILAIAGADRLAAFRTLP